MISALESFVKMSPRNLEIYFVGFVDTLIEHHELPVAVCGVEMEVL